MLSVLLYFIATVLAEVDVVDTMNFLDYLNDNQVALFEFYAPWCGHCKKFAPAYEEIGKHVEEEYLPYGIAKVDGTQNQGLMKAFGVESYPTLVYFENGKKVTTYSGERTKDGVLEFLNKMQQPAVTTLKPKEAAAFGSESDHVLISYHKKGGPKEKNFGKWAKKHISLGIECAEVYIRRKKGVRMVLRRNMFDEDIDGERQIVFKGKMGGLQKFFEKSKDRLVYKNPTEAVSAVASEAGAFFLACPKKVYENVKLKLKPMFEKLKKKGYKTVFYTSFSGFSSLKEEYGDKVSMAMLKKTGNLKKKYVSRDVPTASRIIAFIEEALKASPSLDRYWKSVKVEAPLNLEGKAPVIKTIGGNTYHKISRDEDRRTVVVMVQSGNAKVEELMPELENFSQTQMNGADIFLFDPVANDCDDIGMLKAIPSFMYFEYGTPQLLKFEKDDDWAKLEVVLTNALSAEKGEL